MIKKFSVLCLVTLLTIVGGSDLSAGLITSNGDLLSVTSTGVGSTPINVRSASLLDGFGVLNQVNPSAGSPSVGSSVVRSVTFLNIVTASRFGGGTYSNLQVAGKQIGLVTVLEGTVTGASGPGFVTTFSKGRGYVVSFTEGDIATAVTNNTLTSSNIIATFGLDQKSSVTAGTNGSAVNLSFNASNTASLDGLNAGNSGNAFLLFDDLGGSFLSNVDDNSTGKEGVYASLTTEIAAPPGGTNVASTADNFFQFAYSANFSEGGFSALSNGDASFSVVSGNAYVTTAVPEPASGLVFAGMALVGGVARYVRKRKS